MQIGYLFTIASSVALALAAPTVPMAEDIAARNAILANHTSTIETRDGGAICGTCSWFNVGLGSCGDTNNDAQWLLALPDIYQSSNCRRGVSITVPGKVHHAPVMDTCPSCTTAHGGRVADLSPALFEQFAPLDQGIFDCCWYYH